MAHRGRALTIKPFLGKCPMSLAIGASLPIVHVDTASTLVPKIRSNAMSVWNRISKLTESTVWLTYEKMFSAFYDLKLVHACGRSGSSLDTLRRCTSASIRAMD